MRTIAGRRRLVQEIVRARIGDVADLCRRLRVRRLDLFGSGTSERFDPQMSDLDFLVEFEQMAPVEYAEAWFDLKEGLEALFGRPVDLVTARSILNPYFAASIQSSRENLYAA